MLHLISELLKKGLTLHKSQLHMNWIVSWANSAFFNKYKRFAKFPPTIRKFFASRRFIYQKFEVSLNIFFPQAFGRFMSDLKSSEFSVNWKDIWRCFKKLNLADQLSNFFVSLQTLEPFNFKWMNETYFLLKKHFFQAPQQNLRSITISNYVYPKLVN